MFLSQLAVAVVDTSLSLEVLRSTVHIPVEAVLRL